MDMNQTVSRRFEPSSRTTLMGEQPNPWDLLQPQDVMSRHRGAKHRRRYEDAAAVGGLQGMTRREAVIGARRVDMVARGMLPVLFRRNLLRTYRKRFVYPRKCWKNAVRKAHFY